MTWKVIVPRPISALIGSFNISREMRNRFLAALHHELPEKANKFRRFRGEDADRHFIFAVNLTEHGKKHLFVAYVDDVTAPERLIIEDIRHRIGS